LYGTRLGVLRLYSADSLWATYQPLRCSALIRDYAERRGFEIVRTYADEGKSGLRLDGRDALKRLIEDVESGAADFTAILVYDVSRWGRFQDADESAYYEYICKRAGISVHYCAEQFDNDGSPVSTIVKGVKRAMAGEYSRELSAKVFSGQCRLIELGYRQGGPPGYGLRRRLVDQNGAPKGQLIRGEQKSIQTDRIILVPGPPDEVETVRWMYEAFVRDGVCEAEIANILNGRGMLTDLGRPWTRGTVHQVLINEKYIGSNVWNRISYKLKRRRVRNRPDMWIRRDGAFDAIIDGALFAAAQAIIRARTFRMANEQMLEGLKGLFEARERFGKWRHQTLHDFVSEPGFRGTRDAFRVSPCASLAPRLGVVSSGLQSTREYGDMADDEKHVNRHATAENRHLWIAYYEAKDAFSKARKEDQESTKGGAPGSAVRVRLNQCAAALREGRGSRTVLVLRDAATFSSQPPSASRCADIRTRRRCPAPATDTSTTRRFSTLWSVLPGTRKSSPKRWRLYPRWRQKSRPCGPSATASCIPRRPSSPASFASASNADTARTDRLFSTTT
jgi:DNA invertase Pin-like site-specific DNA recombinase